MSVDTALLARPLAVPHAAAPQPVVDALETFEARRIDFRAAAQRVREAEAGVAEAQRLDLLAMADARDRGEADPPPINRETARRAVDAARHDESVEALRVERAYAGVVDAIETHAQAWARAASQERRKADQRALKTLATLREVERERVEARRAAAWVERLDRGEDFARAARKGAAMIAVDSHVPDARNQGRYMPVDELIDAIEQYIAATTEDADEQRVADRAVAQAEHEQRVEQVRQFRAMHPGITG